MIFKRFVVVFFVLFVAVNLKTAVAKPYAYNDSLCNIAYRQIFSLKFDSAKSVIALERRLSPENVYVEYLENMMDALSVFISEDEALLDSLEENISGRVDKIEKLPDSNPYKKMMLANINLQWALARTKFEQFFTAALEINRAYRYISENVKEFPGFVPNLNTMGVLHIMVGLVPDQYGWILSILSMEGTIEQGRNEIYKAMNIGFSQKEWAYLKPESLFYIGYIEMNLSSNLSALDRIMPYLENESLDNLLMDYLKVRIFMRTGKNDKALEILKVTDTLSGYYPFYYLDYLHGECRLRQLNPDAVIYYNKFLNRFNGLLYIKDAWYKKALLAWLFRDIEGYYANLDSVLRYGTAIVDADKIAQERAEDKAVPPNRGLLEVRFLFDGGYYRKALERLDEINVNALMPDEQLEYYYRFGRIYYKTGDYEKALRYYGITINRKGESMRYFAPNAALKSGQIYESQHRYKEALKFYEKCLDMDFDEYYNSIRAKAKDGVERVKLAAQSS